jgi:hypothetical protein
MFIGDSSLIPQNGDDAKTRFGVAGANSARQPVKS